MSNGRPCGQWSPKVYDLITASTLLTNHMASKRLLFHDRMVCCLMIMMLNEYDGFYSRTYNAQNQDSGL